MSTKILRGLRGATPAPANTSRDVLEVTAELKHIYLHGAAALRPDRGL